MLERTFCACLDFVVDKRKVHSTIGDNRNQKRVSTEENWK